MIKYLSLFVGFLLYGVCPHVHAEEIKNCNGKLYNNSSFSKPQKSFSVLDKIYLKVSCNDLPVGNYTVISDWISPQGKLIRQNTHNFDVNEPGDYMSYSWMKLLRKGPLQRNFTGQDINLEHYGEWIVKAYLQGKEVAVKKFTVY